MGARTWADIYDDLLRYQAELSCDLEQMFFRSSNYWTEAKTVLDIGAGNAYYSSMLSHKYPEKYFLCIEKNSQLANIAKEGITSKLIEVVEGSFENLDLDRKVDFVLARHMLSYLSDDERHKFASWVNNITSPQAAMLTIDADDDAFYVYPRLPLLEGGNEKFKEELHAQGGNRALQELLPGYFMHNGFHLKSSRSLIVHSEISGRKYLMAMFMKTVAEIDHGSPLPNEVRDEIDLWVEDRNSYLQYGMFGSLFVKENLT